jgi:Helix-turn-helix domain
MGNATPKVRAWEEERWEWRDLFASEHGPAAMTRNVLHVLCKHMDQRGESCYPGQPRIAKESGMSLRAVQKHLHLAERGGWIKIRTRRRPGQSWFIHEYKAAIPRHLRDRVKAKPWSSDGTWPGKQHPAPSAGSSTNGGGDPARGAGCSSESAPHDPQHPAPGAEDPAPGARHPASDASDTPHDVRTSKPSEQAIEPATSNVRAETGRTKHALGQQTVKRQPESDAELRKRIVKARSAYPDEVLSDETVSRMTWLQVDDIRRLER